jgi:hypothetical protein
MSAPFAQINQGPPSATGYVTSPDALFLDRQNAIVGCSGDSNDYQAFRTTFSMTFAQLALTAITTAQTLFSKVIPAGMLNMAGRTIAVKGTLLYSTTSANVATITIALKLGSVTLCTITTAATNTTASVNLPVNFEFDFTVSATGAVGVIQSHGWVGANIGTAAAAAIAEYLDTNVDGALTVTIGTNPAVADTITINGTLVTFIVNGGTPVGNQVALGTTATATATALYTFLAASADANIVKSTWTNPSAGVVLGTAKAANFVPAATTSVTAKITLSNTAVNLLAQNTLAVTIAASGSGLPSAQVQIGSIEVVA